MKKACVLIEAHNLARMNVVLNFHMDHLFSLGGEQVDKKVICSAVDVLCTEHPYLLRSYS
jgi:hypothetical protein